MTVDAIIAARELAEAESVCAFCGHRVSSKAFCSTACAKRWWNVRLGSVDRLSPEQREARRARSERWRRSGDSEALKRWRDSIYLLRANPFPGTPCWLKPKGKGWRRLDPRSGLFRASCVTLGTATFVHRHDDRVPAIRNTQIVMVKGGICAAHKDRVEVANKAVWRDIMEEVDWDGRWAFPDSLRLILGVGLARNRRTGLDTGFSAGEEDERE